MSIKQLLPREKSTLFFPIIMQVKKTRKNPHGLSSKRQMVVESVIEDIDRGKGMNLAKATEKIYNVKNSQNAANIASQMWKNDDFRAALIEGLKRKKILGVDSRVEKVLDEGLDASNKVILNRGSKHQKLVETPDYKTRLEYVREINKIAGVYAPDKKETRKMTLNIDMTKEELDERIKNLKGELEGE